MKKKLVREIMIIAFVFLFVIISRMWLYHLLFSFGMGIWAMIKLYPLIFRYAQDPQNLTFERFIPEPKRRILELLFEARRKDTILVLMWWASGSLIAFLIYKLLGLTLIS